MAKKKKYECSSCSHLSHSEMWGGICYDCHRKIGNDYTAANYDLDGLSPEERMLVFMYAAGVDISCMFENTQLVSLPDNSNLYQDLDDLDVTHWVIDGFRHGRRRRENRMVK